MTVIPVYNLVVLPNTLVYLQSDMYKTVTGKKAEAEERVFFLFTKHKEERSGLHKEDIYPLGINGVIEEEDSNGFVAIRTQERAEIEDITKTEAGYQLTLVRRPDTEDLSEKVAKQKLEEMKRAISEYFSSFQWGALARGFIRQRTSVSEIMCVMATWLSLRAEERYRLVAEDSVKARTEMIEKYIYEFIQLTRVNTEAESAQTENDQRVYRESAIRKQIEYLQKELDELHPENITDVRRFARKLKKLPLNEEAHKEAKKVLNRMRQEGQNSPEYGNLYDYLDFLTSLPWGESAVTNIDLKKAEEILNSEHYGLKKVKERILQQIAVFHLTKKTSGSILLFVGAPGTGKTSIGKSIAEALERKYVRVSLGGIRDEADIRGHRRTYIGAMPGRIMNGIAKSGVSNPVMVLDEIDKVSSSYNGDPAAALLEVLDPEQNFSFTDHYLNVPYDLSNVFFICTANSLDSIPEPLLNRMEIIEFNGYTASEKFAIAKEYLLPKSRRENGLLKKDIQISDTVLRTLIEEYTSEGGVRGLKKRIDDLMRSVAVAFLRSGRKRVIIHKADLPSLLDRRPLNHDKVLRRKKAGIITGLAYTRAGGEILFVESLFTPGQGKLVITGQLGDVMKESANIALSLVKAKFPEKARFFATHDLHIHVPDGSVPKDGPSAGITLTTSIASILTGKAVSTTYGMTGEVSLRGAVLPIGGLPEKLMAAVRAGVKVVFIPQENVADLEKVPQETRDKLKIIPVSEVEEVLQELGIIPVKKRKK